MPTFCAPHQSRNICYMKEIDVDLETYYLIVSFIHISMLLSISFAPFWCVAKWWPQALTSNWRLWGYRVCGSSYMHIFLIIVRHISILHSFSHWDVTDHTRHSASGLYPDSGHLEPAPCYWSSRHVPLHCSSAWWQCRQLQTRLSIYASTLCQRWLFWRTSMKFIGIKI